MPATRHQPLAALSNHHFQEPKGGGEGKAFLPIFLRGLVCKERGRVSSRQAGKQDGVNPSKHGLVLMVLRELSPSLAPWPQGGDMGAGAAWDSSSAAWHASCHALCPCPPREGTGTAPASYFQRPACGCWGWGTPSAKGTRDSLTWVQWEAHGGQARKGGVEMQTQDKLQLFSFTPGCSWKQCPHDMASTAPLRPRGPRSGERCVLSLGHSTAGSRRV